MPTGALVAALTTSLPETPRGARNWDYRYCWMRDASFTLWGLHSLGLDWEADDFVQYVADLDAQRGWLVADHVRDHGREGFGGAHAGASQGLRIRPPGTGRKQRLQAAPERRLRGRARLRLPALQEARPHAGAPLARARGPGRARGGGVAQAGSGDLGGPGRAPALRLLEAHVLGRARPRRPARGTARRPGQGQRWQSIADHIRKDILTHGVDGRGVFRQHYETDALDASNL